MEEEEGRRTRMRTTQKVSTLLLAIPISAFIMIAFVPISMISIMLYNFNKKQFHAFNYLNSYIVCQCNDFKHFIIFGANVY